MLPKEKSKVLPMEVKKGVGHLKYNQVLNYIKAKFIHDGPMSSHGDICDFYVPVFMPVNSDDIIDRLVLERRLLESMSTGPNVSIQYELIYKSRPLMTDKVQDVERVFEG